jgi:hypothetical protein
MTAVLVATMVALLVAVVALVVRPAAGRPASGAPERAMLSRSERALVEAAADAFFPPGGPIPLSGSAAGAAPYLARYLARSGARERLLLRLLLHFTEWSPLAFGPRRILPRWARFSRMPFAEQVRFLEQAGHSRLYLRRVAFLSLRALLSMAYLANDEVTRAMGARLDTDPFGLGARAQGHAARDGVPAAPASASGDRAPPPLASETRAVGAQPLEGGDEISRDGTEAAE